MYEPRSLSGKVDLPVIGVVKSAPTILPKHETVPFPSVITAVVVSTGWMGKVSPELLTGDS